MKIMFLCTGNSCRSQMAEALVREEGKGLYEVHSAGLSPGLVNPRAVDVMREIGIDISNQRSKGIHPELLGRMDVVITLCGHAEDLCPVTPPGIRRLHWPVEDPAPSQGTEVEILDAFRRARDDIRKRIGRFIEENPTSGSRQCS